MKASNLKIQSFTLLPLLALSSFSVLSNDTIEGKYEPLEMSEVNRPFYNRFINSQPILSKERNDIDKYTNYNLLAFSTSGSKLNKKNLLFVNNYLSDRAYIENNLSLVFNINNHISGQIHTLNQELNEVRKRINIEEFFTSNKEYYGKAFDPFEFFKNQTLYNEINTHHSSEYIYEEKKIVIEFGNMGKTNTNISFYCSDDIKFAYIIGNSLEERNSIESVNNNTRTYISLSDEIKNSLEIVENNQCAITKHFDNHEDAIDFMDILRDPRSRFILEFKINEKQNKDSFYIKATSSQFGLYSFRNNFINLYDDFDTSSEYKDIDFIEDYFNKIKDEGYFDYQDLFEIENYYNTELFYPTRAGHIRFDTDNSIAYLFDEDRYKIRYKMEKINNYYHFTLYKIDYINTYNFPREIYFRKLYDGFDLFINYSYDFNSNIIRVGDTANPNVRY